VIIDTHTALRGSDRIEYLGRPYAGRRVREHGDTDTDAVRRSRTLASLDNTWAFMFDKESLIRLLKDTGFSSVYSCDAPLEPLKPADRMTVVAVKGVPVRLSSYPWVNDKTESEIEAVLHQFAGASFGHRAESPAPAPKLPRGSAVNRLARRLGFEIRRIRPGR
jgi:hypothetical protein